MIIQSFEYIRLFIEKKTQTIRHRQQFNIFIVNIVHLCWYKFC